MDSALSFLSRRRRRMRELDEWRLKRLLLVVLSVTAVAASACSSDGTFLPALLADPMASYEAEGLELTDSWEYAQSSGFLGSGPVQAEVGRTYSIDDQTQAEQLLEDAVAFAEAKGWTMTQPQPDNPDFYLGTKELVPGSGELSVWLGADDPINDRSGIRQLKVFIEFDPVPTG